MDSGDHRDEALRNFEIEADCQEEGGEMKKERFRLTALDSEPNLWRVVKEDDEGVGTGHDLRG